jgi:hypothetical protein
VSHDHTDTCEKCGFAIDFPYEWCVCGLPEKQRVQLEKASLQWFVRDNKPPAPEMADMQPAEPIRLYTISEDKP